MDLPIEHGGSFHSYVNVYQRVMTKWWYNDSYNNDDDNDYFWWVCFRSVVVEGVKLSIYIYIDTYTNMYIAGWPPPVMWTLVYKPWNNHHETSSLYLP